jgi:hypothetical protein
MILNLHALLADDLLPDRSCGALRQIPVAIQHSVYVPLDVPQLISECFDQVLNVAVQIQNPFEQAFFLMVHLPYLQPFEDVNKRVSRLAANIPFIREKLCPLSFVDVPEKTYINALLGIYEMNRLELMVDVFVWSYERSSHRYATVQKTLGEPDLFRMKYRLLRKKTVALVVQHNFSSKEAIAFIRAQAAQSVPSNDQARFIEIVETELMNLHEGNISRYNLTPPEFNRWHKKWK